MPLLIEHLKKGTRQKGGKMRFAYLIMAHDKFDLLGSLIATLDDPNNDLFIHIDAKAGKFPKENLSKICMFSNVYWIEKRLSVSWGGYSQIECVLNLITEASSKGNYDYYHLLSGIDMPIKNHEFISNFFENNKGKQFIGIIPGWTSKQSVKDRFQIYYPLQETVARKNKGFLYYFSKALKIVQKCIGVKRNKDVSFFGGPSWFSIDERFAKYLISQKQLIHDLFVMTDCCDEVYLQTIIINSAFKQDVYDIGDAYHSCMRLIDWQRGNPYTFDIDDLPEILNSDRLFVRKIGNEEEKQRELVEYLEKTMRYNPNN